MIYILFVLLMGSCDDPEIQNKAFVLLGFGDVDMHARNQARVK